MTETALVWLRRDLRLADNPALRAALDAGFAPQLVYIDDPEGEGGWPLGAASRAWLRRSLAELAEAVASRGGRLLLEQGDSLTILRGLAGELEAGAVYWNRRYEPAVIERDQAVKQALRGDGLEARSFNAALLREPWTISTQQGGPYKVFTPYWRRVQADLDEVSPPCAAPRELPPSKLEGRSLDDILPLPSPRWDRGFWEHHRPGEAAAHSRMEAFFEDIDDYPEGRDRPDLTATSRLSPHLAFGEISPRQILHALREDSPANEEARQHFIRELGWREFSYHLLFHFPECTDADLTSSLKGFDWAEVDEDSLEAWRRGRTGIPIVDAGMRELWATGTMHNRVRMIVASLLTKNLRYHWLHGARWFWNTLVDADLANNTQGWQWSAGTGADAAPYFRIFNPVSQGERHDPDGAYVKRWVPELQAMPLRHLQQPWTQPDALARCGDYPAEPLVDLKSTREAALAAYKASRS
ncbi:cryptochrome/photolyase family protein [Pseudomarimonas salicorniae]|uniref:DNA photolyase family protein n=1 Tax=Pseudomarimonas salicorniae TaxID=2933270 RepID=A0ABT0GJE5_9GAMM|nr:deoxyribodipyrimidine photo-lyase [Lysobacter sp. CAU 1642]MCK7594648.1 DNA photolyase family protein [Lysobacter sp. CAU 1642]